MGMYTEIVVNTEIETDAPDAIINALRYMTGVDGHSEPPSELPDHPLFATSRWAHMLRGGSYYFIPFNSTRFERDISSGDWYLSVRSDFKNYDQEADLFFDWITPYCCKTKGEFIGYSRYEEHDVPKLFYK